MLKKGRIGKYIIYRGISHRVKFTIIDNTDLIKSFENDKSNHIKDIDQNIKFSVEILENGYKSKTSYSNAGKCIYYGNSFWNAWRYVQKYIFNANLPKQLEKYTMIEQS
jgi:hypothetical protein